MGSVWARSSDNNFRMITIADEIYLQSLVNGTLKCDHMHAADNVNQ
jgi:hypothetical protein